MFQFLYSIFHVIFDRILLQEMWGGASEEIQFMEDFFQNVEYLLDGEKM